MFGRSTLDKAESLYSALTRSNAFNSIAKEKGTYAEGQSIYTGATFSLDRWPVPNGWLYIFRGPEGVSTCFVPEEKS